MLFISVDYIYCLNISLIQDYPYYILDKIPMDRDAGEGAEAVGGAP